MDPLLSLIALLRTRGYRFVTPTPATHARVIARPERRNGRSIEDVLGWSLPFAPGTIDPAIADLLKRADALEPAGEGRLKSRLRVSSLKGELFVHSAYPTDAKDSVFFGPDSYRFADLIEAELAGAAPRHIVDIGTGAGVGGIVAAKLCPGAQITMTDLNPEALRLAEINARGAGIAARFVLGGDLSGVEGAIDLALANPPYIIDSSERAYRDGGGMLGAQVSLDMARMAVTRLGPGGRLILYSGSAIVDGHDGLREALASLGCDMTYREIDPDVFGEELDGAAYRSVDRIAAVGAVLRRA